MLAIIRANRSGDFVDPFALALPSLEPDHEHPMLEQRIEQQFIDSADLKYQSAQVLSKPIASVSYTHLTLPTNREV